MPGYSLFACPTLYPGQTVEASLMADQGNSEPASCRLYIRHYAPGGQLTRLYGPEAILQAGEEQRFSWRMPATGGWPIAEIGLEIQSPQGAPGSVYLDYLDWKGAPEAVFIRPEGADEAWLYAWVNAADYFQIWSDPFRVIQNRGTGLLIHGTMDWDDYRVEADVTPHMAVSAGLAARVQGLKRYYAVLLGPGGKVRLVKVFYDKTQTLAEAEFPWEFGRAYTLRLEVKGDRLAAAIDGQALLTAVDRDNPLLNGAIALVCEEGRTATQVVTVRAI
jgi:hypothetical protein